MNYLVQWRPQMSPTSKDEPNLTQPNPIPTQSIMFTLSIWLEGNQPPSISVGSTITLLGIRTIRPTCKTVNIAYKSTDYRFSHRTGL